MKVVDLFSHCRMQGVCQVLISSPWSRSLMEGVDLFFQENFSYARCRSLLPVADLLSQVSISSPSSRSLMSCVDLFSQQQISYVRCRSLLPVADLLCQVSISSVRSRSPGRTLIINQKLTLINHLQKLNSNRIFNKYDLEYYSERSLYVKYKRQIIGVITFLQKK